MKYEVGSRIRKHRLERNMTQRELAKRIGVSSSRVSNWEQGIDRPDVDMVSLICAALQVDPNELLDVNLSSNNFSEEERRVIAAYRNHVDIQKAVRILLRLE